MEKIWKKYSKCELCPLAQSRTQVVFGNGNIKADILLIKTSPTREEDLAGTFLTPDLRFLIRCYRKAIKSRSSLEKCSEKFVSEHFITSSVICRPAYTEGAYIGEERKVQTKEISACSPRLIEVIYEVDPHIIICCGTAPINQLKKLSRVDISARQTGEISEMFTIFVQGKYVPVPYSVIPAPCLQMAEVSGDYDYEDGKVLSVVRALKNARMLVRELKKED